MEEEKRWISSEELFSAIGELLAENRQAVFTVTGMSMWPFLCHGRDQVVVEKCDVRQLKKGDIVLFQTPLGNYVLHRIIGLSKDRFESMGDGNWFEDGWFPMSCVRARVVKIIRKGKTIQCDNCRWRIVSEVWGLLYPIRSPILRMLTRIGRLKNRIRRK
ncbi:MAG: S24/S26 family peptidase [Coprococcus sp.]